MESEEIFVMLLVAVLMGIVQNLTLKSYFASFVFVETPIFVQALTLDQCFDTVDIITVFVSAVENICTDESLTLWKIDSGGNCTSLGGIHIWLQNLTAYKSES